MEQNLRKSDPARMGTDLDGNPIHPDQTELNATIHYVADGAMKKTKEFCDKCCKEVKWRFEISPVPGVYLYEMPPPQEAIYDCATKSWR